MNLFLGMVGYFLDLGKCLLINVFVAEVVVVAAVAGVVAAVSVNVDVSSHFYKVFKPPRSSWAGREG